MFDSGITAKNLISQIREEAEISYEIPDERFVQWLNSVEQLLYSEVIREQKAYTFGIYSPLVKTKLNFCPLLEVKGDSDTVVTVASPGVYNIKVEKEGYVITDTGVTLENELALPAGTYTLSDNVTSRTDKIMVINPATNTNLAYLSPMDAANKGATFTLAADTKVIVRIEILASRNLGINGYTVSPQIETGDTKTAFVPPMALSEKVPRLACGFPTYDDEADMRFEDIYAVYADDRQLIKSTLASGVLFPYTYYRELDDLGINVPETPDEFKVVYLARPVLKTPDVKNADGEVITSGNFGTEHVKVPAEFIELVSAKLRGEACKLANEDALAAKWLSDYNVLLETFKTWIAGKQPSFGL